MTVAAGVRLAYRRLAQFHENEAVVAWWRRLLGPVLAWLSPGRRRVLLAAGALYVGLKRPIAEVRGTTWLGDPHGWLEGILLAAVLFALFVGVFLAARHYARLPAAVRQRPQVALHAVFWAAVVLFRVAAPSSGRGRVLLGTFVTALPLVLWRLGYLLRSGQRGRMSGTGLRDHLMYVFPLWGGTSTPIGKGLDYLARHEARTDEALARSQLAGLKLLLLSLLWTTVLIAMEDVVYGNPGRPVTQLVGGSVGLLHLRELLARAQRPSLLTAWLSLYADLVRHVLRLAMGGHRVVGLLRLAGFNVFRNTYQPLLAESVVEFWNRYYYYFKELLADFFFFPTFVRWFKGRPQLRMFAATFMAACVGNVYYHLVLLGGVLLRPDLAALGDPLSSRAFYCVLLALGISVSMRREQKRRGEGAAAPPGSGRRALRILGVWTFFALISVWGAEGHATFAERTWFFVSLFGLGW